MYVNYIDVCIYVHMYVYLENYMQPWLVRMQVEIISWLRFGWLGMINKSPKWTPDEFMQAAGLYTGRILTLSFINLGHFQLPEIELWN